MIPRKDRKARDLIRILTRRQVASIAAPQRLRNEELRVDAHSWCEAAQADSSSEKAVTLQIQSVKP